MTALEELIRQRNEIEMAIQKEKMKEKAVYEEQRINYKSINKQIEIDKLKLRLKELTNCSEKELHELQSKINFNEHRAWELAYDPTREGIAAPWEDRGEIWVDWP